jgi:hypothetical protein
MSTWKVGLLDYPGAPGVFMCPRVRDAQEVRELPVIRVKRNH